MAFWRTKAAISLKRVKMEEKLLWRPIGTHQALSNGTIPDTLWPPLPRDWGFATTPLISGTGKATDFKFGGYIYRANSNKSPLKILEKMERGRIPRLHNFLGTPYYLGIG